VILTEPFPDTHNVTTEEFGDVRLITCERTNGAGTDVKGSA